MSTFDKKSLPQKIHLSGSDCFHLVLDKHAKKHNSGGNVMRIVFNFSRRVTAQKISATLKSSPLVYWLCNIELVPGSLLKIPYWKYENKGRELIVSEHHHDVNNQVPEIVLKRDIPIDALRFIDCDLVHFASHSMLVLSWNHIVMDGKGIGMFLQHLNEIESGGEMHSLDVLFPPHEKKPNIIAYIRNMYKVKRFIQASSKSPIASVADKRSTSIEHFDNYIIEFNKEETAQIAKNAVTKGARFGPNLFYLAGCAHAVNNINAQRGRAGTMWMPIPYDGRLRGAFGPVISNFVAYLFYRLPQADLADVETTVKSFTRQMTEQMKDEMPKKYGMLLNMLRHIPLGLYYFLINRTGEGTFASFLYSSTGENFNRFETMFGEPVTGLTIFPSPTFPPGLTFSFLKHNNALNINIAYSSDIISNIELDTIVTQLKQLLLAEN